MGTVGVISHLPSFGLAKARALAQATEGSGADWLGLPDAFWWHDTWLLVAEAARVTERIGLGPLVTNPYLRHPFHTVAAVATVQELAGNRVFVGIGAGGSEVSSAAGISRHDAPARVLRLASLLRSVGTGAPLDPASGRSFDMAFETPTIMVAGRGDRILDAAGRTADKALLWAVPLSDLERSAALIVAGAAKGREAPGDRPEIVWAPLVDYGDADGVATRSSVAYSVLNSSPDLRARWGLGPAEVAEIRRRLVSGSGLAAELVPRSAVDDLLITDPDPSLVAVRARRIGATSIALPAFSSERLAERVTWARAVLAQASRAERPLVAPN
jgi:5,10-methylenetetrahydromethanopterin reductase